MQKVRCCDYCHKPIWFARAAYFKDKVYHLEVDEHGSTVNREHSCWIKSEQGTKSL